MSKKREQQRSYTFCLQDESQEIASDIILSQQTQSTYSSIILLGANVWILHHLKFLIICCAKNSNHYTVHVQEKLRVQ